MPKTCMLFPSPRKRSKTGAGRSKREHGQPVESAENFVLKPSQAGLQAVRERLRAALAAQTVSKAKALVELNYLIDYYRTHWIQVANIRDRLLKGKL